MAKYCGKCGSRLDEATGLCPSCDAAKIKQQSENLKVSEASAQEQGHRAESKGLSEKKNISPSHRTNKRGQKKAAKREKRANWSTGKKVRKFFMKLILTLLLLVVLAVGAMGALVYFDMINIPLLSTFNQNSFLKFVNEKNIIVEEKFEQWKAINQSRIYVNKGIKNNVELLLEDMPFENMAIKKNNKDKIDVEVNSIFYLEAPVAKNQVIEKE